MLKTETLVYECLKDNRKAQRQLYDLLAPVVYGVCQRYSTNKYHADDLFQEAFIRVFKKLYLFDQNKGTLEAWASRVTLNVVLAQYRDKHLKESEAIDDELNLHSKETSVVENMTFQEMLDLVNTLPDKQKIVFNLFAVEGYSHKEIAEALQIDEGTSRSQLNKARKNLKMKYTVINAIE